jgi:hypothetical protein
MMASCSAWATVAESVSFRQKTSVPRRASRNASRAGVEGWARSAYAYLMVPGTARPVR